MSTIKFCSGFLLLVCFHFSVAAVSIETPPASMRFLPDQKRILIQEPTQVFLKAFASEQKMSFYSEPKLLPLDAVIADSDLQKAILITANRRTNPEFFDKIYKHESGHFAQVKIFDQQLSLFFYGYSKVEIQNSMLQFKKAVRNSKFSLLLSPAEAQERPETASGQTSSGASSPSNLGAQPQTGAHKYVLGEEFLGCSKGILQGLNDVAKAPWNAGWAFGTSAKALWDNPPAWWQGSIEEFKGLASKITNFRQLIGKSWASFSSLPAEEQSKTWCTYLGTPALMGTVGKVSKASQLASNKSPVNSTIAVVAKEEPQAGLQQVTNVNGSQITVFSTKPPKALTDRFHFEYDASSVQLDKRGFIGQGKFFGLKDADINLITPEQLKRLPKGTILHSINGEKVLVGIDRIDDDTRGGFLAYGVKMPPSLPYTPPPANLLSSFASSSASSTALSKASVPPPGFELDPRGLLKKGHMFGLKDADLHLIRPEQLSRLPAGTVLHSINGNSVVVGVDIIDGDTRAGFLAFGFKKQ